MTLFFEPFSQMDFFASIKREVECFEVIYDVIWYLVTHFKFEIFDLFARTIIRAVLRDRPFLMPGDGAECIV